MELGGFPRFGNESSSREEQRQQQQQQQQQLIKMAKLAPLLPLCYGHSFSAALAFRIRFSCL